MLKAGEAFAGYTIVRPLGAGGMGEVYLAEHPRLPRADALKIVRSAISADSSYQERFIREADLAAKLWHPNIVGVHDRGESGGQLWIAMDFVEGRNAEELLSSRYPAGMPYEDVVAIVTGVAEALDYAHKQGLVHRDIKPSNIMLADPDEDGRRRILLADFGIARTVGEVSGLTATNMTVGTVAYSAPEQLLGMELDGRADQYALAATAYHLLTGSPVFPDSNPAVVISRHQSLDPPAPSTIRPELAAVDAAFARALAKKPGNRFARCQDFARALASASTTTGGSPIEMSASARTQEAPVPAQEASAAAAATRQAAIPSIKSSIPTPPASAATGSGARTPGRWKFAAVGIAFLLAIGLGVFYAARPNPTTTASVRSNDDKQTDGSLNPDLCRSVSAPLSDVPTRTDQEPKMRIPLPAGWERSTKMDNESIRFAIRNPSLTADGFTPNAVVTLQKIGAQIPKPEQVLEAQNEQLATKLKLTDMSASPDQVCGATALSSTYIAPEVKLGPEIPPVPARTASSVSAIYEGREANYVATLTVQTLRPDDKTFVADSETILKGFQLLPPPG